MEFVKTYPETWRACRAFTRKIITAEPPKQRHGIFRMLGIKEPCFASYVSKRFPYTYTGGGIVFSTEARPAKVLALDSVDLDRITLVHGLQAETEEGLRLLKKNFIFDSIEEMKKRGDADTFLRKFMELTGSQTPIGRYTEVVFEGNIRIEPKALFDFSDKELKGLMGLLKGSEILCNPESLPRFKNAVDY